MPSYAPDEEEAAVDTSVLLELLTAGILGELLGVVADPLCSRPADFADLLLSLLILWLMHFHIIFHSVCVD